MKIVLNIPYFLGALLSFLVAYSIMTYKIDQYIKFAGEDNALGCFVISAAMGMLLLFASFERLKKSEK